MTEAEQNKLLEQQAMSEQFSNWLNHDHTKRMFKALNNLKASRVNDSIAKLNSNKDLALSLLTEASAINEVVSSLSNLDKTKKLLDIQN
jgi:hypothetical protein